MWEADSQGVFSIEQLFQFQVIPETEFLETCDTRVRRSWTNQLNQPPSDQEIKQNYWEFLNLLHGYLTEFEIYNLIFSGADWEQFCLDHPGQQANLPVVITSSLPISTFEFEDIILGRTYGDYWIGIGKVPDYHGHLYSLPVQEPLSHEGADLVDPRTLEFVNEFTEFLQIFPQQYLWTIYPTREGALRRLLIAIKITSHNEFDRFESSRRVAWRDWSQATQLFIQDLQSILTNIYEYRLFDRYTYVIGQTSWGDWAGVWTQDSFNP
ncbi:hypothetical protein DO97_18940 [Neosynechococcus sphagnicola sy1]|uniref:Uncharacterized protein n=1 Tax=Neosynechococcus sphagnicola sy1 TaxID=1497020 RepID=A0A098TMQ1_9CYAN|nr:hypothetical protein DO97_18940 [Neosynechococcus sphagnicola sy1]